MTVSGPVTLATAARLLDEGRLHLAEGVRSVDFSEVTEMDSTLLALSLAWLRDARAAKREIAFVNPPDALQTLSRLYGVENLLPLKA
jgi:phospholipid transport system transporter-binding protein